jgi:hypothetical protein
MKQSEPNVSVMQGLPHNLFIHFLPQKSHGKYLHKLKDGEDSDVLVSGNEVSTYTSFGLYLLDKNHFAPAKLG